jgi:hypothetical protein
MLTSDGLYDENGHYFDGLRGRSLKLLAQRLARSFEDTQHLAVYDDHGFKRGWIWVKDGEPMWRST